MTDLTVSSSNQALEPSHTPDSAEALDASDAAPEPLHDDGITTDVPAGYVSDAELLAWLQAKSTGQYGELDQLMDTSNARSELIKKLSHLKETLADANADPTAALAELQTLRTVYAGTENAAAIEEIVGPIEKELDRYASAMASVDQLAMDVPGMDESEITRQKDELKAQIRAAFGSLTGPIDATVKDLEHDDQLALIQIQALMSDIRETAQLTSNIIASRSQTSDSLVGNIRA